VIAPFVRLVTSFCQDCINSLIIDTAGGGKTPATLSLTGLIAGPCAEAQSTPTSSTAVNMANIIPNPRFIFTLLCKFKKTRPLKSKKLSPHCFESFAPVK
jgi:hypothetical protein